ncbi:MAG: tyrosine decarboxylase MfnA [Candidatus Helarchaeota archaeon]
MKEEGLSQEKILRRINRILGNDMNYSSGKILGSMCTKPLRFTNTIYTHHLDKNLGDPGLWVGTWSLERDAIRMIGKLLHNPEAVGYLVTGGTEANLIAVRTARNHRHYYNTKNEIIVPESAHASFDKAADLMRLKIVKVPLNEEYSVDIEAVKEAISPNTICLVGIAGTTSLGTVDDVKALSDLAIDNDIHLHVDAAFGGFVIPFLKELGHDIRDFDFTFEGVRSITIDPHKMGLGPIPAGGIIFRNSEVIGTSYFDIPYLAGGHIRQATIVGTRSGASVIAMWATMKHLGRKGYREIVKKCMNITNLVARGIDEIDGVRLVRNPVMNVVGFTSDVYNIYKIDKELRRSVVMPHVEECHVEKFLFDLEKITNKLVPEPTPFHVYART